MVSDVSPITKSVAGLEGSGSILRGSPALLGKGLALRCLASLCRDGKLQGIKIRYAGARNAPQRRAWFSEKSGRLKKGFH